MDSGSGDVPPLASLSLHAALPQDAPPLCCRGRSSLLVITVKTPVWSARVSVSCTFNEAQHSLCLITSAITCGKQWASRDPCVWMWVEYVSVLVCVCVFGYISRRVPKGEASSTCMHSALINLCHYLV